MTIADLVTNYYQDLLDDVIKAKDDGELYDLVVEYKSTEGVTYRVSYRENQERLMQGEIDNKKLGY